MDSQYTATEYCDNSTHNPDTEQGQMLNKSVWATLVRNWSDPQSRWTLRSPMARGAVDPGPFSLPAMDAVHSVVASPSGTACAPFEILVTYQGEPAPGGLAATIQHGDYTIGDVTASDGGVWVYGASPGDVFNLSAKDRSTQTIVSTRLVIPASCPAGPLTATLLGSGDPAFTLTFQTSWGTAKVPPALSIVLPFTAEPAAAPVVAASQDGGARVSVVLTDDPTTHTYRGSYTFDPARAANFAVDVTYGGATQTYAVVGEQFHTAGPFVDAHGQAMPLPAPAQWRVLPAEGIAGLTVSATSLPDGAGVSAGETNLPAAPPSGLISVGGPLDVAGTGATQRHGAVDADLPGRLLLRADARTDEALPLQRHRRRRNALPTTLLDTETQATAPISAWGIFTVFARTEHPGHVLRRAARAAVLHLHPVDGLPAGRRGLCRRHVPSGRQRHAQRQIAKMVTRAYNQPIDPPISGGYTFTSVPPGSPFYVFVEGASRFGLISGYTCGGPGEPCDDHNRPYFRPYVDVTRGQMAKIVALGPPG